MAGDFRLGGNDHGYYGYYDYEVVVGGGPTCGTAATDTNTGRRRGFYLSLCQAGDTFSFLWPPATTL